MKELYIVWLKQLKSFHIMFIICYLNFKYLPLLNISHRSLKCQIFVNMLYNVHIRTVLCSQCTQLYTEQRSKKIYNYCGPTSLIKSLAALN